MAEKLANREGGDSVPSCTPRSEGLTTLVVALYVMLMTEPAAMSGLSLLARSTVAAMKACTEGFIELLDGCADERNRQGPVCECSDDTKVIGTAFEGPEEVAIG